MISSRHMLAVVLVASLFGLFSGTAAASDQDIAQSLANWAKIKQSLFGDRQIADGKDLFTLEAPERAADAAVTPVAIHFKNPQTPDHYVKDLYLIIDNNPSPIAGDFHMTPLSGRADLQTRIRINNFTYLRAVAEYNDGKTYMVTRFVKASGGCSTPADKDWLTSSIKIGRMKLAALGDVKPGQPDMVQLMISHPNRTGLAKNQITLLYDTPLYVRDIKVTYGGKLVMSADVSFSISENPNFRFYFEPSGPGELKAEADDTAGSEFKIATQVSMK